MKAKFILCSHARVGSYMVATALDAHSELAVAGEIFLAPADFDLPKVKCVTPLRFAEQPSAELAQAYIQRLRDTQFLERALARF